MGMSTHVYGILDINDDKFQSYKEIASMCYGQGLSLPKEVGEYFKKYEIDIDDLSNGEFEVYLPSESYSEYSVDMSNIIDVDIRKLPENIAKIRFCNRW